MIDWNFKSAVKYFTGSKMTGAEYVYYEKCQNLLPPGLGMSRSKATSANE